MQPFTGTNSTYATESSVVNAVTLLTHYTVNTAGQYLQPMFYIYGEITNYAQSTFYLKSAVYSNCPQLAPVFNPPLVHQSITLTAAGTGSGTYTFTNPVSCQGDTLTQSMTVDKYILTTPPIPTWISITWGTTTSTISFSVTTVNVGINTIRLTFTSQTNTNIVLTDTFFLEVYPHVAYGAPNNGSCPTNVWPMHLGGSTAPLDFYYGDVDSTGSTFAVGGIMQTAKYLNGSSTNQKAFLASFSSTWSLNFLHTFDSYVGYSTYTWITKFVEVGYVFSGMCFVNPAVSTGCYQFGFYKFTSVTGQLTQAKQLSGGINNYLITIDVNTATGDIYLGGDQKMAGLNLQRPYQDGYVMKLNSSFAVIFFKTYAFNNYATSTRSLALDATNGNIYVGVYAPTYWMSYGGQFAVASFNAATGATNWQLAYYNLYVQYLGTKNSIVMGPTGYLYFCQSTYDFYASYIGTTTGGISTSNGNEIKISKISTTGAASSVINREFYIAMAMQDCSMIYNTADGTLYVTAGSSSSQSLLFYKFDSSFNVVPQYLQINEGNGFTWTNMAKDINGNAYIFYRGDYSYNYAFIARVNMATTQWNGTCSNTYVYGGTFTGINNLTNTNWENPVYYQDMLGDLVRLNYKNPDQTTVYYQGTSPMLLTPFPSGCYAISAPTAVTQPDAIGITNGYTVGNGIGYYTINPFQQCQNQNFTYTSYLSGGAALPVQIALNTVTMKYTISTNVNSYQGMYTIILMATNTVQNTLTASTSFRIEIVGNTAPFINTTTYATTSYTMDAWHSWSYNFQYAGDNQNDIQSWNATLYTTTGAQWVPAPSWFTFDNTSSTSQITVSFAQPPNAVSNSTYAFQIFVWDYYNYATPRLYNFTMKIIYNAAPKMTTSISSTITSTRIPWPFNYTLNPNIFTDTESDQVIVSFNTQQTLVGGATWASYVTDPVTGLVTLSGTPPYSNSYQGSYTFPCTVQDQFDGTPNIYYFYLTILPALPIIIVGNYSTINTNTYKTIVPLPISIDLSKNYTDPQLQQIYSTVLINGTVITSTASNSGSCSSIPNPLLSFCINSTTASAFYSPWITWNPVTSILTMIPFDNIYTGQQQITIQFTDNLASYSSISFYVNITKDWPLILVNPAPNYVIIVGNYYKMIFNQSFIFTDPMNFTYSMYLRMPGSIYLPSFVNNNVTTGNILNISGLVQSNDIGSYTLELVGVNFAGWITTTDFLVSVLPCYFKCQKCWDANYNTCTNCKPGYFLYTTECVDTCLIGTYPWVANLTCMNCPTGCAVCFGPDAYNNCTACSLGYFYLNNGCYKTCPAGYWGDTSSYICSLCNPFCSICYGPSSAQCTNCTETFAKNAFGVLVKVGYYLAGTECKVPKCADGQFFQWYTYLINGIALGTCLSCNTRCKTCIDETSIGCLSCYPGAQIQSNNYCKTCAELFGYFTNDQMNCQEICGDGYLVGQNQCDDNNTLSGDGCSSSCSVEFGYGCNTTNPYGLLIPPHAAYPGPSVCKPNIPPQYMIISVAADNSVSVKFSSVVNLQSADAISADNMNVQITGPLSSYIFTWRLPSTQSTPLLPARNITQFVFIVENFQQTMQGGGVEIITLTFNNYTLITDIYQNTLLVQPAMGNISPYTYVPPSTAAALSGGGESLKYTFLSVFGFNMIIKVVLKSSMGYLWSLVHALQIFNYLLLLNINFPNNLNQFTNYLAVATGNVPEFSQYIPDASTYLINQDNVIQDSDSDKIPACFIANGMQPYLIVAYGRTFTIWAVAGFLILPSLYLMNKLCKKVKLWEDLLSTFFYNAPMRTFVETYIDSVIQIILNTKVIKFSNYSQIVATLVAFAGGVAALVMPFVAMNVIYNNRRNIRKAHWVRKFGMLTEEVRQKDLLQLYYYPAFMYQRLVIAAIIVYGSSYPAVQCYAVIACNLGMIFYLVTVKPFREENQQTTTVVDEIVIMICVCFFLVLVYKADTLTDENQTDLGWAIIFTICFSVIKNFSIVIYKSIQKLRDKLKSMFGNEEEEKRDTVYSDESNARSESIESIDSDDIVRDPGMRSDAELILEIRRERQVMKKGEKLMKGPTTAASLIHNDYPTMIYVGEYTSKSSAEKKFSFSPQTVAETEKLPGMIQ